MRTPVNMLEELVWFHQNAPYWEWKWAKTFEGGAEHSYVMRGKQLDEESYFRALRVAQVFGRPGKFYRRTNIEFTLPALEMRYGAPGRMQNLTGFKFWPMSNRNSVSRAFNIAPIGSTYGEQNATKPQGGDEYFEYPLDSVATIYDDLWGAPGENVPGPVLQASYAAYGRAIWKVLNDGDYTVGNMLDLGARSGHALDWKLNVRDRGYVAVEPSQGMVNQLVYKHPTQQRVFQMPLGYFLDEALEKDRRAWPDTTVALVGSADDLTPETVQQAYDVTKRRLLLMFTSGDQHPVTELAINPMRNEAFAAARALPGAETGTIGEYKIVRVTK